jgi:hypothetical protein
MTTLELTPCGLQFDTAGELPFTPALQLLYVNGAFAAPIRYRRGAVYIDVIGDAARAAMWLDVERFDATVDRVPGHLDERHAAGLSMGGIYVNRSNLAAVEAAAGSRPHYLIVATLDGTIDVDPVPGVGILAAVQAFPAAMVGPNRSGGINADVSVVVDKGYWEAHALLAA